VSHILFPLIVAALTFALHSDDPKPDEKKSEPTPKKVAPTPKKAPEITLKPGDTAPPLLATKWLQGSEVTKFEADKVYVVEFWATWCGPCIVMMPHLGEIQREYRDKGVTIIGYTKKDPGNTAEKVTEFVEKRGPKLGYTFAYAEEDDSYKAWMQAAGRNGIPCTFIVGKDGKIAYIGHPMYLDVVLPKVVAGVWNIEKGNEELKAIEADVNAVFKATSGKDTEAAIKTLAEFEAKYPELNKIPYFIAPKVRLLLKQDKVKEATEFASKVIAGAIKSDDSSMLGGMASTLIGPDAKKNKDLAALALDTAKSW
jgi:thiol-disulfide isomerase/thioredoxin